MLRLFMVVVISSARGRGEIIPMKPTRFSGCERVSRVFFFLILPPLGQPRTASPTSLDRVSRDTPRLHQIARNTTKTTHTNETPQEETLHCAKKHARGLWICVFLFSYGHSDNPLAGLRSAFDGFFLRSSTARRVVSKRSHNLNRINM